MSKPKTISEIQTLLDQLKGDYWFKKIYQELVKDFVELAEFISGAGGSEAMQEKLAKLGWALRVMTSAYLEVSLVGKNTESRFRDPQEQRDCIGDASVSIGG